MNSTSVFFSFLLFYPRLLIWHVSPPSLQPFCGAIFFSSWRSILEGDERQWEVFLVDSSTTTTTTTTTTTIAAAIAAANNSMLWLFCQTGLLELTVTLSSNKDRQRFRTKQLMEKGKRRQIRPRHLVEHLKQDRDLEWLLQGISGWLGLR